MGRYTGKPEEKTGGGDRYLSTVEKDDRSAWDQAKRAGGSALIGLLRTLDAPRAAVAKLDDTPTIAKIGKKELKVGHLVPGVGQLATAEQVRKDAPKKGVAGFLANTALDIVEDPLTYASFGTGGAAKSGLKVIGKELGEDVAKDVVEKGAKRALTAEMRDRVARAVAAQEGGSEKAAAKLLKAVDKGGQGGVKLLGQTVIPGKHFAPVTSKVAAAKNAALSGPLKMLAAPRHAIAAKFGKDVADDVGAVAARARASAGRRSAETIDRLFAATREAGATDDELRNIVLPAIDAGGDAVAVPDRLRPLVETLKAVREEATQRQLDEGLLPLVHDTDAYVPRFLTEAGRRALDDAPEVAERFGVVGQTAGALRQGGHTQARTMMPDAPIRQVEDIVGGQLRQSGRLKGDLLDTNPLTAVARRAAIADRAVAQKQMLDELADVKLPNGDGLLMRLDDAAVKPAGWVEFDMPEVGKFAAPKEIAEELTRVGRVLTDDRALREFDGLLGELNTLWKGYATVPIVGGVGFHGRNATGNVFNNWLAGVKNPKHYARAMRMQRAARRDTLEAADREVYDLAVKHGVIDSGFFMSELSNPRNQGGRLGRAAVDRKMAAGTFNPLSTENIVIRSGRAVGSAVENNARLAHFLSKLDELGSADEAARSTKKFLFDYSDLTEADRAIKRYAAFWTWMRKSTPLMFASMARQPGKFSAVAHAQQSALEQVEPGEYPQWALREGMVPLGGMMVGLDLPMGSASEALNPTPGNLIGRFGGLVPGLVKAAVEEHTGESLFSGLPVKGSFPKRLADAAIPLIGKVERAPYTAAATGDPQAPARAVSALTGLQARVLDDGPAPKKTKKKGRYT